MNRLTKLTPLVVLFLAMLVILPYASAEDPPKVNINTASLDALTALDGIGPQYAQRIIEHREKNGPFAKPEDIVNVKGIGIKTFEAIKDKISVQ
jgi:competence protein ComEA